jgi:hypothetical protein
MDEEATANISLGGSEGEKPQAATKEAVTLSVDNPSNSTSQEAVQDQPKDQSEQPKGWVAALKKDLQGTDFVKRFADKKPSDAIAYAIELEQKLNGIESDKATTPDEYDLPSNDGSDKDFEKWYKEEAHKLNLSKKQAKDLFESYNSRINSTVTKAREAYTPCHVLPCCHSPLAGATPPSRVTPLDYEESSWKSSSASSSPSSAFNSSSTSARCSAMCTLNSS